MIKVIKAIEMTSVNEIISLVMMSNKDETVTFQTSVFPYVFLVVKTFSIL